MDTSKNRVLVPTLPNNPSSQILVKYSDSYKELDPSLKGSNVPVYVAAGSSQDSDIFCSNKKSPNFISRTQWITVAILTFVNLINYMDRYTIAGQLLSYICQFKIISLNVKFQKYFKVDSVKAVLCYCEKITSLAIGFNLMFLF